MTKMRKLCVKGRVAILTAICCGALFAIPATAQDAAPSGPPPGGRMGPPNPERQLEMLTKRLNLTSDQQPQVKAILEDESTQMQTLRNDTSLSQDDRRSKMMSIRKSSQDKIRGMLTDEQKTKYLEAVEQIYPGAGEEFVTAKFLNWHNDQFSRGSYSFPAPGQVTTIGPQLQPGAGPLHFAGEHCCYAFIGYMEGALQSGVRLARKMAERDRVAKRR